MWRLEEIRIRNIVSFQDAELNIAQGVATLIFGKNEDNASQPCNGSGKSSLIEAISLALTGEQLRKVKSVEEIINDFADEAYVFVRLENDYNQTSFTIERTIRRNGPQQIICHKYDSRGMEIEQDKTLQPTVADYNKFILNEIGLSKEDIYNNYILCDNKYESFFDCSDKNKKEIINRFSNGYLVDESISRVQQDMEPIIVQLHEAKCNVGKIEGSIFAIEHELSLIDKKKEEAKEEKELRLSRLDAQIQSCRENIESAEENKARGEKRLQLLLSLQKKVEELESSEVSLKEGYRELKEICDTNGLGTLTDFEAQSEECKDLQEQFIRAMDKLKEEIKAAQSLVEQKRDLYIKQRDSHIEHKSAQENLNKDALLFISQTDKEIAQIDAKLDSIEVEIKNCKKRKAHLDSLIALNETILNGAVTCPKCKYKFLLGNDSSVEELQTSIQDYQKEINEKDSEISRLDNLFVEVDSKAAEKVEKIEQAKKAINERNQEIEADYKKVLQLTKEIDEAENMVASLQRKLTSTENNLDKINGKIEVMRNRMFGEVSGMLDGRILNGENYISQTEQSLKFYEGQLVQYRQSRKDLIEAPETDFSSSLQASLKKYTEELAEANKAASEIQAQYTLLKNQEVHFTMFKSHLARKKIDALSLIVNDFLEKIGSDIRLKLEGFSVTKTGKLRDKISVQVMRDGIDCGSYHKFSGGEKARLNLACILSLHTLTNSNCEDGKGLDFIIIDELLDKSDEVGMATYCDTLNRLGQTSLLITQGGVSEGYPHKLLIVKKQGISTISD